MIVMHRPPKGLSDPVLYRRFARDIADGNGYVSFLGEPTAYYPPGYPYFLGVLQRMADLVGLDRSLPLVAGLAQAMLGGVAAGAVVVAGRELGRRLGDERLARGTGLAAGSVMALWPNLILYSGVLLSETLFIACLGVFVAALLRSLTTSSSSGWRPPSPLFVAAASLGAATLVRPQVLVVLPAMAVAMIVARRPWRKALADLGVLCLGVLLVLCPWIIRNAVVLDAFVPLSNNGGDNLCVGFHPGANGRFQVPRYCDTGEFYIDGPAAELRRNRETARRARRWATSHLSSLPALSVRKLWHTYNGEDDGLRALESYEKDLFLPRGLRSAAKLGLDLSYLLIMAMALLGAGVASYALWQRRGRDVVVAAVVSMAAASALVPVIVFGDPRFKVASTPLLAIAAGLGVLSRRWWGSMRRPRGEPWSPQEQPAMPDLSQ